MARPRASAQTAPGEAVYLLHVDLRVPTSSEAKFRWLDKGSKATTSDLAGLVIPALEQSGFIQKVQEASVTCVICEDGKTYTPSKLTEHWKQEHPGFTQPE